MKEKLGVTSLLAVIFVAFILVMITMMLATTRGATRQEISQWNDTAMVMCPENVPIVGKWIVYGEPVYMEVIAAGDKFFENRSSGTTVVTFDTPPEYWSFPPGNTGVDAGD